MNRFETWLSENYFKIIMSFAIGLFTGGAIIMVMYQLPFIP